MSELPPGWRRARLGDVCEVLSGSTPKTSVPEYWGGDIPWLTPDDLSRHVGKYVDGGRRSLTQGGYDSCSTRLVPKGSVLYSSRAPIGYAAIANRPICTNQGFKTAVPGPDLIPDFLYWQLLALTDDIRTRASGTTFREISGRAFAATEVVVPPLDEQHHIVAVLEDHHSRLDAAEIYVATARLRTLRLAEAALNAADIATAPEVPLRDLLEEPLANGRSIPDGDGAAVLRLTALRSATVDVSASKLGAWTEREAAPFQIRQGDLLLSRGNGSLGLVGRAAMVVDPPTRVAFPDTMIRVRPNPRLIAPALLLRLWNGRYVRRQIEAAVRTTAGIYKVNQKQLLDIRLRIPPVESQSGLLDRLDTICSDAGRLSRALDNAAARSRSLRRSLLEAAFTGRL